MIIPSLPKTAIKLLNLSVSYAEKTVINQINCCILQGEKVGLVGANGSGKTTLFLAICGLLSPQMGEIFIFDQRVESGQFYPEIGFIFQNPDDQLFSSTVRDDIVFGLENLGLPQTEIETRLSEVVKITGIEKLLDRIPHNLSGGEKSMVAIAAILAMRPHIVLYDEPSANLDLKSRRRLVNFLLSAQQTLWISSHDLELILEVCDRVVVLNHGQIVADGNPHTLLNDPSLMEANGLEVPYSLRNKA